MKARVYNVYSEQRLFLLSTYYLELEQAFTVVQSKTAL